jgi:predicted MFS family arabinose efflux permease
MNSTLKFFLVAMITVSVVSDSMLLPFYPQFFSTAFAISAPQQVGFYLSAICFVVMLAFPVWAAVAKAVPVLRLLIYTQFAAGVLSLLCYSAESLGQFWQVSLLMMLFKASYLLIYPFVMSLEQKQQHHGTIALLSVIAHLGAIVGAGLGGFVLQLLEPRAVFLLMAVSDFMQIFMCLFLLGKIQQPLTQPQQPQAPQAASVLSTAAIYQLGWIMLLFYSSTYLIRPFFSRYWESVTSWRGEIITGLVFAIPGMMALLALSVRQKISRQYHSVYEGIMSAMLIGFAGLLLQAYQQPIVVLVGRCLFGWALFQATVRLDVLLFELSTPAAYAVDFSKIYFFQSLGALLASFAAGELVAIYGLQIPFMAGAAGLVLTAFLYALLFRAKLKFVDLV